MFEQTKNISAVLALQREWAKSQLPATSGVLRLRSGMAGIPCPQLGSCPTEAGPTSGPSTIAPILSVQPGGSRS